jgi:hypothetical protein
MIYYVALPFTRVEGGFAFGMGERQSWKKFSQIILGA